MALAAKLAKARVIISLDGREIILKPGETRRFAGALIALAKEARVAERVAAGEEVDE